MSIVHSNPYYSVSEEQFTLPDGGSGTYYGIRGLETVMVVPIFPDRTIGLIKQWRYLYTADVIEFPAGRINPGESKEAAARRELVEETGWQASQLQYITWFAPCNGLSDEHCYLFLASDLTSTPPQRDRTEQISTFTLTISEFDQSIQRQQIQDGMTLAAWALIRSQL